MVCNKPKFDVFVHSYYSSDTRVIRHCEELAAMGFSVTVFSLWEVGGRGVRQENGVRVYQLPVIRTNRYLGKLGTLAEYSLFFFSALLINSFRLNHVYVNNMPNFYIFSAFLNRFFGKKLILDVHDLMPELFVIDNKSNVLRKLLVLEERLSHKYADLNITVNDGVAKYLRKRTGLDYGVVYNSMLSAINDFDVVSKNRNKFELVFHGNIQPQYNIQRIFEVLPRLKVRYPKITFHLYGQGPYLKRLKGFFESEEFRSYCFYHGPFDPSSVPAILKGKGIGLLFAERGQQHDLAVSVKCVEYMSCGLPLVASNLATLEEIFGETVAFYESTSNDDLEAKIVETIEDYPAALRRARQAQERCRGLSWGTQASTFRGLISDVIKGVER